MRLIKLWQNLAILNKKAIFANEETKGRKNIMTTRYEDIENWKLSNGKTIKEINNEVHDEVEKIYLDAWAKGVSVPYFDGNGNIFLANPDGSDDSVELNKKDRSYKVISRVAAPGKGRMAYLMQ